MRFDVLAAGAVVYLLVAGAAARIPPPPAAMMEARSSRQIEFRNFSLYLNPWRDTMIRWALLDDSDSASRITNVSLYRIDDDGRLTEVVGIGREVGNGRERGTSDESAVARWRAGNRFLEGVGEQGPGYMSVGTRDLDSETVSFDYNMQGANGSATLLRDAAYFKEYFNQGLVNTALCLSVGWDGEPFPMRAYSKAFAITEDTDFSGQTFKKLNETLKASNVAGQYEGPVPDDNPSALWQPPASASAAAAASADAASNGGGSPGLSVAAQAGIGVGAGLAGLLLLGGLVFLFCRRRRRRGPKPYGRGAGGDFASDSGVMVRDKEMAGVSQSGPHSLYASDPGRLHEHGAPADSPVVGGGGGGGGDPRRYSGYAGGGGGSDSRHSGYHGGDHPRHSGYGGDGDGDVESYHAEPVPGGTDGGSGAAAAAVAAPTDHAPSRPTSEVRSPSRYAHLIEEGMTEDEIQRLEEEERQLDAAIENAGRRSRSA